MAVEKDFYTSPINQANLRGKAIGTGSQYTFMKIIPVPTDVIEENGLDNIVRDSYWTGP